MADQCNCFVPSYDRMLVLGSWCITNHPCQLSLYGLSLSRHSKQKFTQHIEHSALALCLWSHNVNWGQIFTRKSRMLHASSPSSGRLSVCLSISLSVCPSVTLVICIKTVQARITKSSLWAAPRSVVYCDKISCH